MLSSIQILESLKKSDRWGVNEQPANIEVLAEHISTLPVKSVEMENDDTCVIEFTEYISDKDAEELGHVANIQYEDGGTFSPYESTKTARLWWD